MNVLERLMLANVERTKEWDPEHKLTPLFFATELGGECGEALNVVKKLEREKLGLRGSCATPDDLAGELADVVIVAAILASEYNIDLPGAVVKKFNATSDKLRLSTKIGGN